MKPERLQEMQFSLQKLRLARNALISGSRFVTQEITRGTLASTLGGLARGQGIKDMSWADLLAEQAGRIPDKTMLQYRNEEFTYRQMDENANRAANLFVKLGGGRGKGVGIFMRNSPRFLDIFFGVQKIGMYVVPINCELKGDGLQYIINHSDIEFLAVDAELLEALNNLPDKLEKLKKVVVDDVEAEAQGIEIGSHINRLSEAYLPRVAATNPGIGYDPDDMCLIIYTSGTTGRPKGVVNTYGASRVKFIGLLSGLILRKDDVYYTSFSLCHGNALLLTVTLSMSVGCTIALSRRFSASKFWEKIRRHEVTIFNTIGSVIPILMKQPEKPTDSQNRVRIVFSAACPAEMWDSFEKRFGVKLYEGYGAVDGGGKGIMNFGTAPPGSLGKSAALGGMKIVDKSGKDVPPNVPGEMIFKVKDNASKVTYYRNEQATNEKVSEGWLYTGDLVKRDSRGYVYFVGRNTESMRKGGENVSAYEVEHVIMKHPAVEDVAVYAVPSDLAEDEIMASVKLVERMEFDPRQLLDFLTDKLARFAIPRYIRVVDEFPMTNSHRIIKGVLEKEGVTGDTYDARHK